MAYDPTVDNSPIKRVTLVDVDGQPETVGRVYRNIAAAATTVLKSGEGVLRKIIVNKGVATATVTVYDNTSASGTKIATITFGAALLTDPPLEADYDCIFNTGLTVVTSDATDITVVYS